MRGSNHSYLFCAFRHKLVPSFSLDRGPTWGRNPKSKSVKWTTLKGQFVVQKWFNAPVILYPSAGPKGWGFQLTGALPWIYVYNVKGAIKRRQVGFVARTMMNFDIATVMKVEGSHWKFSKELTNRLDYKEKGLSELEVMLIDIFMHQSSFLRLKLVMPIFIVKYFKWETIHLISQETSFFTFFMILRLIKWSAWFHNMKA